MQPLLPLFSGTDGDDGLSAADGVARGVSRLMLEMGFTPLLEFKLGNGRRVDVAALDRHGTMIAVEIKVSMADLRSDMKWPEYLPFCDRFYFALPPDFPHGILDNSVYLPQRTGIILADRFQGVILRPAVAHRMNPARRRSEILRFARRAARRLALFNDPGL